MYKRTCRRAPTHARVHATMYAATADVCVCVCVCVAHGASEQAKSQQEQVRPGPPPTASSMSIAGIASAGEGAAGPAMAASGASERKRALPSPFGALRLAGDASPLSACCTPSRYSSSFQSAGKPEKSSGGPRARVDRRTGPGSASSSALIGRLRRAAAGLAGCVCHCVCVGRPSARTGFVRRIAYMQGPREHAREHSPAAPARTATSVCSPSFSISSLLLAMRALRSSSYAVSMLGASHGPAAAWPC